MASLSYIPKNSTLLLLFRAARARLIALGENPGPLSDARLASATEELNRIADDVRQAHGACFPEADPAALGATPPAGLGDAAPKPALSAAPAPAKPATPHLALKVDPFTSIDLSAEPDGVQWAGEYHLLAARREKAAFVSLLVRLGYSPEEFRVTVRRLAPSGREDMRQRYSVLVVQTEDGVTERERRYVGGDDAEWVTEFSRDAATAFPCSAPFRPASERRVS